MWRERRQLSVAVLRWPWRSCQNTAAYNIASVSVLKHWNISSEPPHPYSGIQWSFKILVPLDIGGEKQDLQNLLSKIISKQVSQSVHRDSNLGVSTTPRKDLNWKITKSSDICHRMSEVSGPTGPEESSYQLSAIMDVQDSGRWLSPLGGGIKETKREWVAGREEERKGFWAGRKLLHNCFHKTFGCCKTLCFPKTLFPPFSLKFPLFLFFFLSSFFLFYFFTALFLGGGGRGGEPGEGIWSGSSGLFGFLRRSKQGKAAGTFQTPSAHNGR